MLSRCSGMGSKLELFVLMFLGVCGTEFNWFSGIMLKYRILAAHQGSKPLRTLTRALIITSDPYTFVFL